MDIVESQHEHSFSIGDSIPYFCLRGTDDKIYTLSDYVGTPCLVVIFTSNYCPYSRGYEQRILDIHKKYKPFGVELIAVCSNDGVAFPEDSFENMKLKQFPFPYLHDEAQIMAAAFNAQATPEVYVFDDQRILRFHGPIDDSPEGDDEAEERYLDDAIQAILDGGRVSLSKSPVIGCSIKWRR